MKSFWLKIQWAKNHIENLQASLDAIESHPYPVTVKRDPETRERVYYATKVPEIPSDFALSAGDILYNLRSALDHLACALVLANGGTITNSTEFPIVENAPKSDRDTRIAGKIQGMRQEAKDYILSIQPYRRGNSANAPARLHKLNIRDKHRLLLTFAIAMGKFNIGQHLRETGAARFPGHVPDQWVMIRGDRLLKEGQKLLVDPPDAKINENPDIRLQIVVNEVGICEGESLIQVLKTSLYWVQGVTADCEKFL